MGGETRAAEPIPKSDIEIYKTRFDAEYKRRGMLGDEVAMDIVRLLIMSYNRPAVMLANQTIQQGKGQLTMSQELIDAAAGEMNEIRKDLGDLLWFHYLEIYTNDLPSRGNGDAGPN